MRRPYGGALALIDGVDDEQGTAVGSLGCCFQCADELIRRAVGEIKLCQRLPPWGLSGQEPLTHHDHGRQPLPDPVLSYVAQQMRLAGAGFPRDDEQV